MEITAEVYMITMFGVIAIVSIVTLIAMLYTRSGDRKYDLYNRILDDNDYMFKTTTTTTTISSDDKDDE